MFMTSRKRTVNDQPGMTVKEKKDEAFWLAGQEKKTRQDDDVTNAFFQRNGSLWLQYLFSRPFYGAVKMLTC
jgi:hypothetical protein